MSDQSTTSGSWAVPSSVLTLAAPILLVLSPGALLAMDAETASAGYTIADLLRATGLTVAVACIVGLLLLQVVRGRRHPGGNHKGLLLVLFAMLPVVMVCTTGTLLEETKTVQSCASCHGMQRFVKDLTDPRSNTLAARHYKNKWIPQDQCYTCHTTYGLHGTLDAKLSGVRHWWEEATGSWSEPIHYRGIYPDSNCLICHGGTPKFLAVKAHAPPSTSEPGQQLQCYGCHVPHPAPSRTPISTGTVTK